MNALKPAAGIPRIVSRLDNPFATCWTRPTAMRWHPLAGVGVAQVAERLKRSGRGQIVGPHGAGKSTLLEALARYLCEQGEKVVRWTLHDAQTAGDRCPRLTPGDVLFVDGYEQLGLCARCGLRLRCTLRQTRLVVTTHEKAFLPVLAELSPALEDVMNLFDKLTAERPTGVTKAEAAVSYHRHHGNVRDIWFDLYDQHHRKQSMA